ncbi:MAG TPA: HupE/UreJ family protein [Tepidisphaeraceae bacterium]|jgi:hydrogenase/urease accessory protein HupE
MGALMVVLLASRALAHAEGFSGHRVMVERGQVRSVLTIHTRDMSAWFPPGKYPNYVADVCAGMERQGRELVEVEVDDRPAALSSVKAHSPEVGMIEVELAFPLDAGAKRVRIWAKHLVQLPRGHQQLLFVQDVRQLDPQGHGQTLLEETLSTEQDAVEVDLPAVPAERAISAEMTTANAETQGAPATAPASTVASHGSGKRISFFALGIEHIITGYDHLLFLAALLLVCTNFKQAATVITFFTVAHSITLSLAALDIVRLPSRIVEPAIAASIVYVGMENIFGKHRFAWRALVTFAFGLVHGLGFASALREVGLGSTSVGVAMPLLKFSIGLESGQLAIAAMMLQVMLWLRTRPHFEHRWVPVGSVLVSLVGGYWLVTRVVSG